MTLKRMTQLARQDKQWVWHPFTQMKEWDPSDVLVIEKGQGNYLIDAAGKRYLDGVSSLWANVHGHRHPVIDRAIRMQLGRIAHTTFLGLTHPSAIELSRQLIQVAPKGLTKVFYSDSGSASVEVALKMAFQYWRHKKKPFKQSFLKLTNAYHGDTLGAASVGGIPLFHHIFGHLFFKTFEAPAPYLYRDAFRGSEAQYAYYCARKVEKILQRNHQKIAALIVEPLMQGAAGMLPQPRGYLRQIQALAKKYNVLLIVDEVATGFGRTGTLFACDQEGVRPDFLCLAKGLTGGYLPLSATLTTEEVYQAFLGDYREFKTFFHGHTYSANPLACAAALANLQVFKKEKTIARLQPKIRLLTKELSKIKKLAHVGDIRQVGTMVGIELVRNVQTKEPYPLEEKMGIRVCRRARDYGVWIRPLGNVIVLMPPLSIRPKEIQMLCDAVYRAIKDIT